MHVCKEEPKGTAGIVKRVKDLCFISCHLATFFLGFCRSTLLAFLLVTFRAYMGDNVCHGDTRTY